MPTWRARVEAGPRSGARDGKGPTKRRCPQQLSAVTDATKAGLGCNLLDGIIACDEPDEHIGVDEGIAHACFAC